LPSGFISFLTLFFSLWLIPFDAYFDLKLFNGDMKLSSGVNLMIDERTQHLESIAASLTESYYTVHTGGSPDHRDILETYFFLLEALVEHDRQRPGERPLAPGDTLAPFVTDTEES
jgi:hypothetical protein